MLILAIFLLCIGIVGMIEERDQRQYEMRKKQRETRERQEKEFKEAQRIAAEKIKQEENKKAYEDDDYFLNDYDYYRAYYKDMYGITVGKFPGEASYEKCKANYDLINKIKELKEKQEKVLQRKEEIEQLINDRKGKQITMDEWGKEIDKQNIIKEIKEQKEKEALNNGGIQMSLFKEEIIVTEEEIKNYKHKQIEKLREYTKASLKKHPSQIEINITEKGNGVYKGTVKRTSTEYCFIWDGEHYPILAPKGSNKYRKMNKSWGRFFEEFAEEIMLQCDPSCNLFEIKRKEENKRQKEINKISLEIEDLDI